MRPRSLLIGLLTIVIGLPLAGLASVQLYSIWMRSQGYYVGVITGTELAEYIDRENLDWGECLKLRSTDLFGPTGDDQRSACVFVLAQLQKDPHICLKLDGGEYARNCLGRTLTSVPDNEEDPALRCYIENDGLECRRDGVLQGEYTYDTCDAIANQQIKDWCFIGRLSLHNELDACEKVVLPMSRQWCAYSEAYAKSHASICNVITNPILRAGCQVHLQLR